MVMKKSGKPKIVGVIPSRFFSSRFKGKPLALIAGKPMIQCVYERALQVSLFDQVVVATDDQQIANCVKEIGGKVVVTRGNHHSGTDRIAEVANMLGLAASDIIVNIQGDQPLFPVSSIAQVVEPLIADESLPMATLLYPISNLDEIEDPNHVKAVRRENGLALYFSRLPIPFVRDLDEKNIETYYKHLGIYSYRCEFLKIFVDLPIGEIEEFEKLEQLRVLENGYKIMTVISEDDSIEVDVPADLEKIKTFLKESY